jgi:uncharacterized protein (DUF1330 family)
MDEATVPAYMVVRLNVRNHEEYMQRYGMPVVAMFANIGAEVVAVSTAPKVLEGEWGGNWTVVIRFPSMASAEAWYGSSEYQPLKKLRLTELTDGSSAVFVEGFDPASLAT